MLLILNDPTKIIFIPQEMETRRSRPHPLLILQMGFHPQCPPQLVHSRGNQVTPLAPPGGPMLGDTVDMSLRTEGLYEAVSYCGASPNVPEGRSVLVRLTSEEGGLTLISLMVSEPDDKMVDVVTFPRRVAGEIQTWKQPPAVSLEPNTWHNIRYDRTLNIVLEAHQVPYDIAAELETRSSRFSKVLED